MVYKFFKFDILILTTDGILNTLRRDKRQFYAPLPYATGFYCMAEKEDIENHYHRQRAVNVANTLHTQTRAYPMQKIKK